MKPIGRILTTVLLLHLTHLSISQINTASNGLTATSGNVVLGGTLTGNTNIPFGGFNLNLTGTTGRFGIRLTNPDAPLHVYKNLTDYLPTAIIEDDQNDGYTMLALRGTNRQYHLGVGNTGETTYGLANKFFIWDNDAGAARFVLTTTGNIGIGNNNPDNRLTITAATAGATGLRFTQVNSGSTAVAGNGKVLGLDGTGNVVLVTDAGAGTSWGLTGNTGTTPGTNFIGTTDNQRLVFKTNNAEQATILGSGNFGIGTDNPASKLHLQGIFTITHPTFTGTYSVEHSANNTLRFNFSSVGEFMRVGPTNRVDFIGQQVWSATRGAYFSNTLSGNAIETAAGNVVLNTTGGNTIIGGGTDNGNKLQVNGDLSLTAAQPHLRTPRYPIMLGDESGGTFLFYADNTGRPIHIGTAHGNNYHKFHFQNAGQTGDNVAAYNFVYHSGSAQALNVFNAAQGVSKMLVSANGNLILDNTATPTDLTHKLQVHGKTWTEQLMIPTGAALGKVLTSDASGNATWETPSGAGTNAWVYGGNAVAGASQIGNTSNQNLQIITNSLPRIHIDNDGNVGIGTINVNDVDYKLFVEGSIRTRKVRVDALTWPDYVFQPSYNLRPLKEVEQFIQKNSHLPDVPSAAVVEKEGVDLGDNQAVLLRKIEELTLYIIEQNKRLEEQEKRIRQLEQRANK
jgi:hypothetical protein